MPKNRDIYPSLVVKINTFLLLVCYTSFFYLLFFCSVTDIAHCSCVCVNMIGLKKKSMYGQEDGSIPATFEVVYMIGWSPHMSQPKPLPRGSGTHSFEDLPTGVFTPDNEGKK